MYWLAVRGRKKGEGALVGEPINGFISSLTAGKRAQSFLDAFWVVWVLKCPFFADKETLALRILALSPHYFDKRARALHRTYSDFLRAENERNKESRKMIVDRILAPYLGPGLVVLDYGCGPGWLAKAVCGVVRKVHAVDISKGVLEAARLLNGARNIEFHYLPDERQVRIPDASMDLVYSFAVVQHVTDAVFDGILEFMARKIKPGGRLVLHVQLESPGWRTEAEKRSDRSLKGRIRFNFGLHCFSRDAAYFEEKLRKARFRVLKFVPVSDLCVERFDDICDQHLIVADFPGGAA